MYLGVSKGTGTGDGHIKPDGGESNRALVWGGTEGITQDERRKRAAPQQGKETSTRRRDDLTKGTEKRMGRYLKKFHDSDG